MGAVMDSVHHFIVTRVAIRQESYQKVLDDEWFDQRLDLFRRYYAPTVNSQTEHRFTVLLCADPKFADRIEAFSALLEVPTRIVWTRDSWKGAVGHELKQSFSGAVITTGLDSDDGLAVDFVERVRSEIEPDEALNFIDGLQHNAVNGAFVKIRKRSNPFVSVISTTGRWVFDTSGHKKVAGRVPTVDVYGEPMWLQVIHGENVANEFDGHRTPVSRTSVTDRFPADFEVLQSGGAFVGSVLRDAYRTTLVRIRSMGARLGL